MLTSCQLQAQVQVQGLLMLWQAPQLLQWRMAKKAGAATCLPLQLQAAVPMGTVWTALQAWMWLQALAVAVTAGLAAALVAEPPLAPLLAALPALQGWPTQRLLGQVEPVQQVQEGQQLLQLQLLPISLAAPPVLQVAL